MRWVFVWLAMGCASQRSAESHADYVSQTQTTRREEAERVTVLEFGPETTGAAPRGTAPGFATTAETRASLRRSPDSLLTHGPLLKATITDRGPVVTDTRSGTDLHTEAESASKTRLGPGFWGWFAIAAGGVATALIAWKFRSGLLGGVLRVLGRG